MPDPLALASLRTFSSGTARSATTTTTNTVVTPQMALQLPLSMLSTPSNDDPCQAVSVGPHSPPIPKRLAEKIWRNEFIELNELLPSRLGIPQPTLMDVLAPSKQTTPLKQITSIQQWVSCFNTFIAVVSIKRPDKVRDLLAYSSIVVKASEEFEGTPWLEYDIRFRKEAAVDPSKPWAVIDASSWTLCFSGAKPKQQPRIMTSSKEEKRFHPYKSNEICRNYNNHKCFRQECRFRHVCATCESVNHTDGQCPDGHAKKGSFRNPR